MAHVTVQLGPCCTVPFRGGVPVGPMTVWQMRPSDADSDGHGEPGFLAPSRRARKRRRSRARIASSLQPPAEIRP
jgi:hypothetical protein